MLSGIFPVGLTAVGGASTIVPIDIIIGIAAAGNPIVLIIIKTELEYPNAGIAADTEYDKTTSYFI